MSTAMSRRLDQLTAAVENSVVFWTILAESRGDLVSTAPGVRAFNGPYTCRVIIDDPDRARAADVASIIEQTSAPVTVEDVKTRLAAGLETTDWYFSKKKLA